MVGVEASRHVFDTDIDSRSITPVELDVHVHHAALSFPVPVIRKLSSINSRRLNIPNIPAPCLPRRETIALPPSRCGLHDLHFTSHASMPSLLAAVAMPLTAVSRRSDVASTSMVAPDRRSFP
jgi:hypothetical protein